MKRILSIIALCAVVSLGWLAPASATPPEPNPGVCPEGGAWSLHLSANDQTTFTFTAPDGFLVSSYCVKAGSLNQGNGPEIFTVDPPAELITFGHSSGKEISHFSVILVADDDEEETTTTTSTVPPTTSTTAQPTTTTTVVATTTSAPVIGMALVIERPLEPDAPPAADTLAFTGNDEKAEAMVAFLMIAGGIGLVALAKRRTA